jgi:hypothetical protein
MVSKITLLEPHFDGAQFGPKSIDGDALSQGDDGRKTRDEAEDSGEKSRLTMLVQGMIGFVLLAVVLYATLRFATSEDE